MKYNILYLILSSLLITACTYVSEEDLIDDTIGGGGEITGAVTYNEHVKIIIDNNCLACHSMPPQNGAPMALVSYQQVKNAVENRDLIPLISTQDLSEVMPLGGPRLPQSLIDIVIQWDLDGLLEE